MGFYRPAQLIHDAQRHGVEVRPVDVRFSYWDSSLEGDGPAIRIGLRQIKGVRKEVAQKIIELRKKQAIASVHALAAHCGLDREDLMALAAADALKGVSGHRHIAHWQVAGIEKSLPLLGRPNFNEAVPMLLAPTQQVDVLKDYATTEHSLRAHPLRLIRAALTKQNVVTAKDLWQCANDMKVSVAGLIIGRQSPGTASGVMFVTLEDEMGLVNLIV